MMQRRRCATVMCSGPGRRPADAHQELSISSKRASISFSSMNSPQIGLRHTFTQPQGGVLRQFLSLRSSAAGKVRELGFLFLREMRFHAVNLLFDPGCQQGSVKPGSHTHGVAGSR
jgi:hypothetical protein